MVSESLKKNLKHIFFGGFDMIFQSYLIEVWWVFFVNNTISDAKWTNLTLQTMGILNASVLPKKLCWLYLLGILYFLLAHL